MVTASDGWRSNGLRFECHGCGACCRQEGYVWVDRREIRRLARLLGLALDDFGRRYLRRVGRRLSLTERGDGACVFWDHDRGCTIYSERPRQCRTFPFWTKVLASRESWEDTARMCGGMNQGRRYSNAEIADLESGIGETASAPESASRPASRLRVLE